MEIIKADIGWWGFRVSKYVVLAICSAFSIFMICILRFESDDAIGVKIFFVCAQIIFMLAASLPFVQLIKDLSNLICIKKGNITVKIDKLVDVRTAENSLKNMWYSSRYHTYFSLHFANCIKRGKTMDNITFTSTYESEFYQWSEYKMSGHSLYNSARVGDDYYLIFVGKSKTPSMVYNTRLFYIKTN